MSCRITSQLEYPVVVMWGRATKVLRKGETIDLGGSTMKLHVLKLQGDGMVPIIEDFDASEVRELTISEAVVKEHK